MSCMCVRGINFAYVFTIFYDSVIEVTVLSQESERHVRVLGVLILSFFTFLFLLDSGNVLIVWYFFFISFILHLFVTISMVNICVNSHKFTIQFIFLLKFIIATIFRTLQFSDL